jgi:hypothetical protein
VRIVMKIRTGAVANARRKKPLADAGGCIAKGSSRIGRGKSVRALGTIFSIQSDRFIGTDIFPH